MTTYYSEEHEWITVEGDTATIGITAHAAAAIGRYRLCRPKRRWR